VILVRIFLLLFAVSAAAGELEERVNARLEAHPFGRDALLIPENLVRHEVAAPRATPGLVLELLARPLAAADAAAVFERIVPAALARFNPFAAPVETVDFETLLARYVSELTPETFLEATARFVQGLGAPGLAFPPPQRRETAIGTVSIGGPGPDRHGPEAALIVDPGGDDVYERAPARPGGFSIVVDVGGQDRYRGSDLADHGYAALIDLAGDDRYDMQSGLGAARGGISLLLDAGGDDRYRVRARGQGYAAAGGLGILWDMAGDDAYVAEGEPDPWGREGGLSFAQGATEGERSTLAGGIGILRDDAGDDRYEAQLFAQGAGYYFGLGLLWDRGGADRYRAVRYAQGSGVHQALGVLRDERGDDDFALAAGVGQGVGHDMAVGLLVDDAGEDLYEAGYLAQGSASSNGAGVLADLAGGGRFAMADKALAWGGAEGARGLPSVGVLVHDAARSSFARADPRPAAPAQSGAAPAQPACEELPASRLRQVAQDPQSAMARVSPEDFYAMSSLEQALACAAAAAPPEALTAMWAAFERALSADPATPFAWMIGHALYKRPAPPQAQQRLLAALDAHPSCAVRAQTLLAWPSEERARARLQSACWRERAAAQRALESLRRPAPR
jgi:hypothetical protein